MMEAEVRPSGQVQAVRRHDGPSGWRWAIATLAVVAIVLGAAFAVHSVAARLRRPPATAAPSLPPLSVLAVTAPGTDYELIALDAALGHIVALASDRQPQCPPQGTCLAAPALTSFVVLDGTTGEVSSTTPLTSAAAMAASAAYLVVDAKGHVAYAVAPTAVTLFSTDTGAVVGRIPLALVANPLGAAFDADTGRLFITESGQLLAIQRRADGTVSTQRLVASTGTFDGLTLDGGHSVLYTLRRDATIHANTLLAIDTVTLTIAAQMNLSTNVTLGPLDPATGAVSLFGADGRTYQGTFVNGQVNVTSGGPANAIALGANATLHNMYVAHADDVQVLDAAGRSVAALPVRVYGGTTLLSDPTRNLLYLPANSGSLIIAQDAATELSVALNANTAILLARAALPNYLPDTNQDPAFLDTETFWPGVTRSTEGGVASAIRPFDFWIHFSDLGWTGPYHGASQTSCMPLSGQPNGYQVAFTVTWQQLFSRTHTWTLDVASNGAVSYVSDAGDALP